MIYRILILLVITACSAIAADGEKKGQEIGRILTKDSIIKF